jgi:hypothetical protein
MGNGECGVQESAGFGCLVCVKPGLQFRMLTDAISQFIPRALP